MLDPPPCERLRFLDLPALGCEPRLYRISHDEVGQILGEGTLAREHAQPACFVVPSLSLEQVRQIERDSRQERAVVQALAGLPDQQLLEFDELAGVLGYPRTVNPMDHAVSPRGYRVLHKVPRLPDVVIEHVIAHFGGLEAFQRATVGQLEEVDGVGNIRAKEIREGLRRLQEQNLVDRYLNL